MSLTLRYDTCDAHGLLIVNGDFTFEVHREFVDFVAEISTKAKVVTVDLCAATSLDCAGLAMLAGLHQKLNGANTEIKVLKGGAIEDILINANFARLFVIQAV